MKRLMMLVLAIMSVQFAYADDSANLANIKIKIAGATKDNSYFLCMPDHGCLSILAATKGKVFSMMSSVEMNTMFITNANNMRVYNQGLPSSCDVTVKPNQTITIYGTLSTNGDKVKVNNLHCSLS